MSDERKAPNSQKESEKTKSAQEPNRDNLPEKHQDEHHSQYGGGGKHGGVKKSE